MRYLVLIGVTLIIGIFIAIGGLIWYLCDRYCEKPTPCNMDFYDSYQFLDNHKIFNGNFTYQLWFEIVKVNPETNAIDDDSTKNTKVQVWLEHGPYDKEWGGCTHDIDLDCGGDTFEEAIIKLAELVKNKYGEEGISN